MIFNLDSSGSAGSDSGSAVGSGLSLKVIVWRSEEELGRTFEAGGVTGMMMGGDRMMKVHWVGCD